MGLIELHLPAQFWLKSRSLYDDVDVTGLESALVAKVTIRTSTFEKIALLHAIYVVQITERTKFFNR
jgi:hypothetical protein